MVTEPSADRSIFLADETATEQLGAELAGAIQASKNGLTVFLQGNLGMGKTTLSRGLIRGLGHHGAVKSPTYTLVEPYEHLEPMTYHFDLYRLGDPEELEYMGIRDYFQGNNVCLIEWAERGHGVLPEADVVIELTAQRQGRAVSVSARTDRGRTLIDTLPLNVAARAAD
ncbi:tRNA (adenosine(37)-N6)-threonylcarbamoyltransferase complex ATPase subunit type 1 TsaE [Marinobacter caseinilyticus]|uniref:tRNA (adenosine(37)-N6)-threonylcarbamoyltransferase complex ATPase subunit type 1 TsaE n=1 Tax=Marinobacter caseinilyticus TaxID=2692195 RepID=UPI00140CE344|nr:tRNA (adenosine(37)-N6)-threonylcarbamoyltransferase complex ATPase subunit type 1 TsaE [Marinobacter caseinilyticus]